jgi:predicted DNA binding CopG/RHH family protein
MASYILRNIDPELWRRVKSKAALEGITIKALIEELLQTWLARAGAGRKAAD